MLSSINDWKEKETEKNLCNETKTARAAYFTSYVAMYRCYCCCTDMMWYKGKNCRFQYIINFEHMLLDTYRHRYTFMNGEWKITLFWLFVNNEKFSSNEKSRKKRKRRSSIRWKWKWSRYTISTATTINTYILKGKKTLFIWQIFMSYILWAVPWK